MAGRKPDISAQVRNPAASGRVHLHAHMSILWKAQMKPARLILTAAAGLMLGLSAAAAQTDKPAEAASPPPAAIQNAPPDKIAPSMTAGQPDAETHKAPETVGQQPNASDGGKIRTIDNGAAPPGDAVPDANGSAGTKK